MAEKSLPGKEVVVVSKETDDSDDANIKKYINPVSIYILLQIRSKNKPCFLRRCLNYKIKAKKKERSNSGVTIRFNYRNVRNTKTLKAEYVENFSCPFCTMPCGSDEGLRLHLLSSHDAFNYDFYWAEEDHGPEIDVYLKRDTFWAQQYDPQMNPFMFCSKHRKGRRERADKPSLKGLNALFLELGLDELPRDAENESTHVNDDNVSSPPTAHSGEKTGDIITTAQPATDESSPMVPPASGRKKVFAESSEPKVPRVSARRKLLAASAESKVAPVSGRRKLLAASAEPKVAPVSRRRKLLAASAEPKVPPVSGRRKLLAASSCEPKVPPVSRKKELVAASSSEPKEASVSRRKKAYAERSKAKGIERLKSRQFYHSYTKQPMTYEEVMSNEDSENETDDYALDLEERLRFERAKGLSKEEKRYMYLWNIFVRKQRVIAYGHVPWACEEFTKLHKEEMKSSESFDWWWRMFRITLWNRGLICAKTFNNCTTIFLNSDEAGPSTSPDPANANTQQSMEVDP